MCVREGGRRTERNGDGGRVGGRVGHGERDVLIYRGHYNEHKDLLGKKRTETSNFFQILKIENYLNWSGEP